MRKLAVLGALALAFASQANASIVFNPSNIPQTGEELVSFADQAAATTITGVSTSNSSNTLTIVGTTTTGNQLVASSGHVQASSGLITSLTITPSSPLDALIFDAFTGSGTIRVSVLDNLNTTSTFDLLLGTGLNFVTVDAQSGETIQSVTLSASSSVTPSFTDLRNVGAVFLPAVPGGVPEATTWAMMLLGFAAIALALPKRSLAIEA
jgi:hypothetical protein